MGWRIKKGGGVCGGAKKLVKEIGRGSLGRVYLGRWRETDVAVKMLDPQSDRKAPQETAPAPASTPTTSALLHSSLEREVLPPAAYLVPPCGRM
jgi:serine/threonine protein kinase